MLFPTYTSALRTIHVVCRVDSVPAPPETLLLACPDASLVLQSDIVVMMLRQDFQDPGSHVSVSFWFSGLAWSRSRFPVMLGTSNIYVIPTCAARLIRTNGLSGRFWSLIGLLALAGGFVPAHESVHCDHLLC